MEEFGEERFGEGGFGEVRPKAEASEVERWDTEGTEAEEDWQMGARSCEA